MDNERLLAAKELRDKRIAKLESLKSSASLADILIFMANILIGIEFRLNTRNTVSANAEVAKASGLSSEEIEAITKIIRHPAVPHDKPYKLKA